MNTIKVMSVFMLMILAISAISPMILAQEAEGVGDIEVVEAGTTPDSPLYGLDNAMDRLRLALTFNKAKRAEKALQISEERLAEVKAMIEQKKFEHAEKAEERHELFVEKARLALEDVETDSEEAKAKHALVKITRVQNKIEAHSEKVAEVKARILENHADDMTEEQLDHLEEIFGKIIEKSENMEQKVAEKKEQAKTKYKVLSEKTDEEVEEVLEEIESQGLKRAQERRLERAETRNERFIEIHESRLERAQNRLNQSDLTDAERAQVQARLDNLSQKLGEFEEKSETRLERAKEKLEQAKQAQQGQDSDDDDEDEDEFEDESEDESEDDSNESGQQTGNQAGQN